MRSPQSSPDAANASPPALGRTAIRGAGWSAVTGVSMKLVGLVVQFALGWILAPADFAIYGLAISLTVFTSAMTDGGVQKFLRQQPHRYPELVGPATIAALIFGWISASILTMLGLLSPLIFKVDGVAPIAFVLAMNMAIQAPVAVMRSKLQIDMRFRDASLLEAMLTLVRGSLTVGFAAAGMGPLSFALPFLFGTVVEGAMLLRFGAGRGFSTRGATAGTVWSVIRSTRWIMLAAACSALVLRGDYFVIGVVAESTLANYFFGFQIVASAMLLFTGGAYTVLLPVLARVAHDVVRLREAARRSIRLGGFVIAPASAAVFLAAPAAIHFAWDGKWDGAIVVAQAVAISTATRGVALVASTAIEAQGRWRLRSMLELLDGVLLVAAILGAVRLCGADLLAIAIALGVQRVVVGVVQVAIAGRSIGLGARTATAAMMRFAAPALVAAAAIEVASRLLPMPADSMLGAVARLGALAMIWIPFALAFGRDELARLRDSISRGPSRAVS